MMNTQTQGTLTTWWTHVITWQVLITQGTLALQQIMVKTTKGFHPNWISLEFDMSQITTLQQKWTPYTLIPLTIEF
jgi:hypothetical protein